MNQIIFSEIRPNILQYFLSLQAKFYSHRLRPQLNNLNIKSFSLILLDMLTMEPLQNPIRGIRCTHWECFDESSAEYCQGSKCPLCNQDFQQYEKDDYISEIISHGPFYGVSINVNTGLYFPFLKRNEGNIIWNMEFLKYLSIKNSETLQKSFSYKNENIGIHEISIKISFFDKFQKKILDVPCRSSSCEHLECFDLEDMLTRKFCDICGSKFDENNIYVDVLQYGVRLFVKSKFPNYPNSNLNYFVYYPENKCFQIADDFYDLELNELTLIEKNFLIKRMKNLTEMKRKAEFMDEPFESFKMVIENKNFLDNFIFPPSADQLLELYFDDIEKKINVFETNNCL